MDHSCSSNFCLTTAVRQFVYYFYWLEMSRDGEWGGVKQSAEQNRIPGAYDAPGHTLVSSI